MLGKTYRKISKLFYGTGVSKIPLVKKVQDNILKHTAPESITIFGYKMFLDESDISKLSFMLDHETERIKILKKLVKEGDTVVIVGANIGFFPLFFRSIVGKNGRIIAFEPEPKNFALLEKNIITNKFENVEIYQKAVGSKNSKTKLLLSDSMGQHCMSNTGEGIEAPLADAADHKLTNSLAVDIECIRLDDYVSHADFIKLDAEGYEIEILKGMPNLLQQKITLMSEFYVKLLKNYSRPVEFFSILKKANFSFRDMRNNMHAIDESNFMLRHNENSGATDILCTKNS